MSRAQGLLFGVAVVFAVWNIMNNGLTVRTIAIAALILICLVINIYNNNIKKPVLKKRRRESGKKNRFAVSVPKQDGNRIRNINKKINNRGSLFQGHYSR